MTEQTNVLRALTLLASQGAHSGKLVHSDKTDAYTMLVRSYSSLKLHATPLSIQRSIEEMVPMSKQTRTHVPEGVTKVRNAVTGEVKQVPASPAIDGVNYLDVTPEAMGTFGINAYIGTDGVLVVHIETRDEAENEKGPLIRVYLNDGEIYENPPFKAST